MNAAFLQSHWALLGGLVVLAAVAIILLRATYRGSASGQLRSKMAILKRARWDHENSRRRVRKLQQQVDRLSARGESVKPRVLSEMREQLVDANSLEKIARDKVLVAQNHVRRVIVEEFPPKQHERLRNRFLPPEDDGKPFSF